MQAMDLPVKDADGASFNLLQLMTKQDIGDLVGATRQTVATALKKFNLQRTGNAYPIRATG